MWRRAQRRLPKRVSLPSVGIAFFDIDKTILSVNSGTLWIRRERRLGHLTLRQAAEAGAWLVGYSLGVLNADGFVRKAIAQARGMSERAMASKVAEFYVEEVAHCIRPGARKAIAKHRAQGDALVLLTSSSHWLAAHVQTQLGFDEALCNRLAADAEGVLTGEPVGPICYGEGKLTYARESAARRHVPLVECTFYTDSFSDRAVLEAVGTAVAVNPDPRLKRLANQKGWPVVDWGHT